jgi:hypothetical protein
VTNDEVAVLAVCSRRKIGCRMATAKVVPAWGLPSQQSNPGTTAFRSRLGRVWKAVLFVFLAVVILPLAARPLPAEIAATSRLNPLQANTSAAARQDAVQSIPFDKLDVEARTKVNAVLSNVSVFRRMPVRVIDCDPDMYLFLVRHPDVVVNIWEVMKISQLQLRQVGLSTYRVAEKEGTTASVELIYRSHDAHLAYVEGTYTGPLFARPVNGRGLLLLKAGYVRETNGRYYITNRLDVFVNMDPGGAELLTKAIHPLVGKIADTNFVQTVSFVGSLSKTAEVNSPGLQRLATKLNFVQPEFRQQFANLAAEVAQKSAARTVQRADNSPQTAARSETGLK